MDGILDPLSADDVLVEGAAPPRTAAAAAQRVAPARLLQPATAAARRPQALGKFLFVGQRKLHVSGVTYGPFAPGEHGEYGSPDQVERDFLRMRACGFTAVRTYTVPPTWLLDAAHANDLRVMIGLPWEQHIAFLDERRRQQRICRRVRDGVASCAGHPAVLCFTVGNEIPASIIRWYGPQRVERWLKQLCEVARDADPGALVTYVNYPSTEYLELPFLDLLAFNVYLETPERLRAYLSRLQNLAGDRPLLVAEVGLDSLRNGEDKQADVLRWQIRESYEAGCAGLFVFSWTDEWHRGGHEILDWRFGLTDRQRNPKPAFAAVSGALKQLPFAEDRTWPKASVVVCTYNGSRTIAECVAALQRLDYPDYEIIVVDDGSRDQTASIVEPLNVKLIRTPNGGLSAARNLGLHAASGEVVAYIDDDAYPDPQWLKYMVATLLDGDHAGVGGPNIPPGGDGAIAECVAHSPGGPTHVLLTDTEAEHIPGCNMAFRRDRLLAVGGFDPQFRIAGDDVDLCWQMHQRGWTLGFSPSAVVWHHRRNSVRAYWKQQLNYGRAEAMLERKWPAKYNAAGYPIWAGRLYGKGYIALMSLSRRRIYHGTWGSALFQSVYQTAPGLLSSLPMMPEWYLLVVLLVALSFGGLFWTPLLYAAPLAVAAVLVSLFYAIRAAVRAAPSQPLAPRQQLRWRVLVAGLNLLQPAARLVGRLSYGLTPWRRRGVEGFALPRTRTHAIWSEQWRDPPQWLSDVENALGSRGAIVARGGNFDRWDLELRGGMVGRGRLHMTIEEHGGGNQLVRFRCWPRVSLLATFAAALAALVATVAAARGSYALAAISSVPALGLGLLMARESGAALATLRRVLRNLGADTRTR